MQIAAIRMMMMGQRAARLADLRKASLAGAGHLQNPFTAKVKRERERERERETKGNMTTGHEERKGIRPPVRRSAVPASSSRDEGFLIQAADDDESSIFSARYTRSHMGAFHPAELYFSGAVSFQKMTSIP